MIILGIDPGTSRVGWGVLRDQQALDYGCIEPKSLHLLTIYNQLTKLIKRYTPDALAIEELFFSKNVSTAISVAQARGVILLAAAQANISVASYTPLVIKQAVTGNGKADKGQMQKMIKLLLKLKEVPKPDDTADALAVALTHAVTKRFV